MLLSRAATRAPPPRTALCLPLVRTPKPCALARIGWAAQQQAQPHQHCIAVAAAAAAVSLCIDQALLSVQMRTRLQARACLLDQPRGQFEIPAQLTACEALLDVPSPALLQGGPASPPPARRQPVAWQGVKPALGGGGKPCKDRAQAVRRWRNVRSSLLPSRASRHISYRAAKCIGVLAARCRCQRSARCPRTKSWPAACDPASVWWPSHCCCSWPGSHPA